MDSRPTAKAVKLKNAPLRARAVMTDNAATLTLQNVLSPEDCEKNLQINLCFLP